MSDGHARRSESWWSANWTWAAPLGCLIFLILPIACCGSLGMFLYERIQGGVDLTDLTGGAIELVETHPEASEALGLPIEQAWFVRSSYSLRRGRPHEAEVSVEVEGPDGSGRLHVRARRDADEWIYDAILLVMNPPAESDSTLGATQPVERRIQIVGDPGAFELNDPQPDDAAVPIVRYRRESGAVSRVGSGRRHAA